MTISSNYWYISEHLINFVLPVFLLIIAIVLFILFGSFSSASSNKKVLKITTSIIILSVSLTIGIFVFTKSYRHLYQFETNANRKIKPSILHFENRSNASSNRASLYDVTKTLNLPFYQKETVTENDSFTYLGKNEAFYYFSDNKNVYQLELTSDLVVFKPVNQVSVTKEYAKLTDSKFKDIDFKDKIGPGISSVIVPSSKQDLLYQPNTTTYDLLK